MVLQLPGWCPLQQLSRSPHDDLLSDGECHWRIVYNSIEQILSEGKSPVVLSNFECLLGTAWLSDSVMADMIDWVERVFITNVKGTFLGMSESEEASKRR